MPAFVVVPRTAPSVALAVERMSYVELWVDMWTAVMQRGAASEAQVMLSAGDTASDEWGCMRFVHDAVGE